MKKDRSKRIEQCSYCKRSGCDLASYINGSNPKGLYCISCFAISLEARDALLAMFRQRIINDDRLITLLQSQDLTKSIDSAIANFEKAQKEATNEEK